MTGEITILYFASLGERLNCETERFILDTDHISVSMLKDRLAQRGENWSELLLASSVRCAVNQKLGDTQSSIKTGDEVAFFPSVTGG